MIKYPFHKLLLYLLAISKFDRPEFASLLNSYLPFVKFEFEDPFDYMEKYIKTIPIPGSVFAGIDDLDAWRIYSDKFQLKDLHAAFNQESFEDIVFDTDIRLKMDAMSLCPAFRKIDIVREFSTIDPIYIGVYLDTFSDFAKIENRNTYIARYIADRNGQLLFKQMLETASRKHVKVLLGMKTDIDPKQIIQDSLSESEYMSKQALTLQKDDLKDWIKLKVGIAEKLIKMGAGNKSDLESLVEALSSNPSFEDPLIYTREQLEIEYREKNK